MYDLVIEAIGASAELRRRTRYTIAGFIGDHGYHEDLRSRVQTLDLQDVVRFETGVSESRLQELMTKADVFINLRRPNTEAASLSLIEQLDTGRPVVVLDSGCYAEVPDDAALKLQGEVTSKTLGVALEGLMKAPKRMVEMGRLGQRHGRKWSCARYGEVLVAFVLEQRRLIERRGKAVFHANSLLRPQTGDDKWLGNLGRARASLIYLDRNILPVDPALLMGMPRHELCGYVADVIFGLFNSPLLHRALSRYFARLDRREAYWACARFALLADAVFSEDEAARGRLINGRGCHDPEFWSIVELFPARKFFTAAAILIAKRTPSADELEQCDRDERDGFPIRSRVAALLAANDDGDEALTPLRAWAQGQPLPTSDIELPVIDNIELQVGAPTFGAHVDVSGFHAMEHDRIWTRGNRGFVGLRLAAGTTVVELQVYPLMASKEQPNEITLTFGDKVVRTDVYEPRDTWLRLVMEVDEESASGMQWIALSTNRASIPPGSTDPRVLGVCLRALRVATGRAVVDLDAQRDIAVARLNEVALRMRREDKLAFAPKPAAVR